jgi:hypothetical protein
VRLKEADDADHDHWYFHVDDTFDEEIVCSYYVRLFQRPEFLLLRFSKAQLEEGFWAMMGGNLNCGLKNLLSDTTLPFASRENCIVAMADLYERLFATEPLDTSVQMWWDCLCYDWHSGNRNRARGGEDKLLQDVFFQTLSRILSFDSETCQHAALHGLGHLHHPETSTLIDDYLMRHPSLDPELKTYALAAAKFQVL